MRTNAYILHWTMEDYAGLKSELARDGFELVEEPSEEDIRVSVDYERLDEFASLVQRHLNAEFNYVDVQFVRERLTVLIFRDRAFRIANAEENSSAKEWAISIGLPKEQSDWPTSF